MAAAPHLQRRARCAEGDRVGRWPGWAQGRP
jgi:hypothetical protein